MNGERLAPGAIVEADVEKGVFRGRGLARVGGRVVFVPRAHPGDRVRARITEVHAGWAEGALVEVLRASPGRRASPCPYVPRCGGCAYQDYDSQAELQLKEAVLRESLARAGAAWEGPLRLHASPETGWRLRASLHLARTEGSLRLGLRQEGTRRVVDVEHCLQLSEPMNRAARGFHSLLAGRPEVAARVHGLDLLVRRGDLHDVRLTTDPDAPAARTLAPGQVRLKTERFALTANNITYAAFGEAMKYWQFFPADEGFGAIPIPGPFPGSR